MDIIEKKTVMIKKDDNKNGLFNDVAYLRMGMINKDYVSEDIMSLNQEDINGLINGSTDLLEVGLYGKSNNEDVQNAYLKGMTDYNSDKLIINIIYRSNSVENTDDILCVQLNSRAFRYLESISILYMPDIAREIKHLYSYRSDFNYSESIIANTILSEIAIRKTELAISSSTGSGNSKKSELRNEIYLRNFNLLLTKCTDPNDHTTKEALKQLCHVISRVSEDAVTSNNFVFTQSRDWKNYQFSWHFEDQKYSLSDLVAIKNTLLLLEKNINKLKKAQFTNGQEIIQFANKNLLAGGDKYKWFNINPFTSLIVETRLSLLRQLIALEGWTKRLSITDDLRALDIVDAIFETCTDKDDFYKIITTLENEGLLFKMLDYAAVLGSFFETISFRIGQVMKEKHTDEPDLLFAAIGKGFYFPFDTTFFGSSNKENYDHSLKKIVFDVEFTKEEETEELSFMSGGFIPEVETVLEFKKRCECNPLDWVVIIPVEDLQISGYLYKGGQQYLLPACTAYLLFKKDTIDNLLKFINVTINTLLIVSGVAEIAYAIKAASAAGLLLGTIDLTANTGFILAQDEEFKKNNPNAAKIINYTTWVYVLFRLGYKYDGRGIGDFVGTVSKEVTAFIKSLPKDIAFFLDRIPALQKRIVNKFLVLEYNDGRLFGIFDRSGILVELQLYTDTANFEVISSIVNAEIKVTYFKNGKKYVKKVIETIEGVKNYEGELFFRAKFVENVERDAEVVNSIFIRYGGAPPYSLRQRVVDIILKPGEKMWIVELEEEGGRFGGFATTIVCKTMKQAREKLVILEEFKPAGLKYVMREYEVIKDLKVRKGLTGALKDELSGVTWRGGSPQYQFLDNLNQEVFTSGTNTKIPLYNIYLKKTGRIIKLK